MKRFDVVTLFPGMFDALTEFGITQRAHDRGQFELVLWNPREYATNAYRSVDDRPYGGGAGMVMMADPLAKSLQAARARHRGCGVENTRTVYMSPQGRVLDQALVEELAQQGIGALAVGPLLRLVTSLNVTANDCVRAVEAIDQLLTQNP